MRAYKTFLTVTDPKHVELPDQVPFEVGQRVEVLMMEADEDVGNRAAELEQLFRRTQSLPQARSISEEEIASEIDRYRSGKP